MALVKVFNADSVPVHLDDAGHVLGAGEHGKADPDLEVVAAAIDAGLLLILKDPEPDEEPASPPAKKAPAKPKEN